MNHEELKSIINRLSLPQIGHMSYKNFAILTDDFCEELILKLITKVDSNELQRKMYDIIVEKYTDWCVSRGIGRPFISYPDYISTIDFKLECGDVIEDEPSRIIGTLDDLPRGEEVNDLEELKERIAKLESENARLRTKTEELSKSLTWDSDEDIDEDDDDADSLQQQNEELKKELKELKQQKEEVQKRINELEEENKQLKAQLDNQELPSEYSDERTIKLLTPLFFNNENDARDFFTKVKGLDNQTITDVVWDFVLARKLSPNSRNSKLWTILYAAGIYLATDRNWDTALRNNPKALTWGRQQR